MYKIRTRQLIFASLNFFIRRIMSSSNYRRLPILVFLILEFYAGVVSPQTDNSTVAARAIFSGCSGGNRIVPCLAGKFSEIIERSINRDVELFDGFILKRDRDFIPDNRTAVEWRSFNGFSSLRRSLNDFLDSHVLSLDIGEPRKRKEKDGGGYGFGKVDKKNKKYLYYALTAVTGIFGLSVPIILKGLALVAGKALLASKAALIIIGSLALKKIFQSDKNEKESNPLKVHTHTLSLDDHDRYFDSYSTLNSNNNNNNYKV